MTQENRCKGVLNATWKAVCTGERESFQSDSVTQRGIAPTIDINPGVLLHLADLWVLIQWKRTKGAISDLHDL